MKRTTVCAVFLLLGMISACCAQGRVAPLMPEEFAANLLQNKFNHNGFEVNHTCSGTYYSSYDKQQIRSDCTSVGMISNNMSDPSPLGALSIISLLDFSVNPPMNTFVQFTSLAETPSCYLGVASWLPPLKSTFLRDIGAVFGGVEYLPDSGKTDKWQFAVPGLSGTFFTFYFDSQFQRLVRFDFVAPNDPDQGGVGVTSIFSNVVTSSTNRNFLPRDIFAGAGKCPNYTIPATTLPAHELLLHINSFVKA